MKIAPSGQLMHSPVYTCASCVSHYAQRERCQRSVKAGAAVSAFAAKWMRLLKRSWSKVEIPSSRRVGLRELQSSADFNSSKSSSGV
ncbi:Uncharacterized protein HZ326_30971 [Fusarium oxysporum f. sp. albedinis]|nr:Uncharacterized protein HZ326_30971 [Fusarium oxysporum f. sp. albedinis]